MNGPTAPSTGVDMVEERAAGALEGWRVLEVADGLAGVLLREGAR